MHKGEHLLVVASIDRQCVGQGNAAMQKLKAQLSKKIVEARRARTGSDSPSTER